MKSSSSLESTRDADELMRMVELCRSLLSAPRASAPADRAVLLVPTVARMAKFDKGQVGPHVDKLKELDGATSWCAPPPLANVARSRCLGIRARRYGLSSGIRARALG